MININKSINSIKFKKKYMKYKLNKKGLIISKKKKKKFTNS